MPINWDDPREVEAFHQRFRAAIGAPPAPGPVRRCLALLFGLWMGVGCAVWGLLAGPLAVFACPALFVAGFMMARRLLLHPRVFLGGTER